MKKKIALLLAAVMTVGSLPMTAFASTTNEVSSIKTVEDGDAIEAKVFLSEFKGIGGTAEKQTVKLTLTNAKFVDSKYSTSGSTTGSVADAQKAFDDAVAASTVTSKSTLDGLKDTLDDAQDDLDDAKAAVDEDLQKEIEDAEEALADAEKELVGYVGEDGKSGSIGSELTSIARSISTMNGVLSQDGTAGSLVEAVTDAKAALTGDLAAVLTNNEITINSVSLNTVGSAQFAAYFGTALSTTVTNNDFDTAYGTAMSGVKAHKLLSTGAKSYKFSVTGTNYSGLSAENKAKVDEIVADLNAEYAKLIDYNNYVSTQAATLNTNLGKAKTAADNKADKEATYNQLVTDNEIALKAVKDAETAVAAAESAYRSELVKDTAVWNAYQNLVAAQNGSSTGSSSLSGGVTYTKISDTVYMAEFDAADDDDVVLDIFAEADGSGDASVSLEPIDSVVTAQTLKIANIANGATTTTISGTTSIKETATKIKNLVITETTAGSIDENATIKLKLTNGFEWCTGADATSVVRFPSDAGITAANFRIDNDDKGVAYIDITGESTGTAVTLSLTNAYVKYNEDDVEIGDECEVTVSDDGVTKESVVIGKATDYGVEFSVEDKDLPTFYAGRYDDDAETLVVTIKENIENSWLENRKTKIVFPEGVEVMAVTEDDSDKIKGYGIDIDENEVEIINLEKTGKAELDLKFELSVAADFSGDIEATLTGSGVGDDQTVTVATATFPVTVDADVNELPIDYRDTAASDIVITEADAGVLEKGDTVYLKLENINFDGTPTVEVESGDMKIDNVKVTNGGTIKFDIKTASQKEAAVIRISDINLYMERSLPAGEYDLKVIAGDEATVAGEFLANQTDDAIIKNYNDGDDDKTGVFDVDSVTVKEGYITVVTAGRDQDDSTFTTTVTVPVGASTIYAGTKEIALDVPAYISNGYTMMPVRAVTEALSGSAIVRWDDATKTVVITFGQRVISMTVGSNVMKINGVDVAMQAQCEITDSRAFIPLRDLGYALGLNDSKITWDDATKTATLN